MAAQSMWRETNRMTAAATTGVQSSAIVRPGEQWYAARVAVRNQTRASTVADLSIDSGGTPHHLYRFSLTSQNVFYNLQVEVWLRESEQLRLDWSSIVAADVLDFHIVGIQKIVRD